MKPTGAPGLVRRVIGIVCLVCLLSTALSARTIYVATTGSDAAGGSEASPLRTIQRALDEAYPGDTILIAGGVYPEYAETVRHGQLDAPIVIAALDVPRCETRGGQVSDRPASLKRGRRHEIMPAPPENVPSLCLPHP